MTIVKRGDFQEVVGDDLYKHFRVWFLQRTKQEPCNLTVKEFVEWLHVTGPGSDALGRIKEAPRQLFLPFGDDDRPWKEVH